MRKREVLIARLFDEAIAKMADYYESMRPIFPDSGSRLSAFADRLFEHVIPMLEKYAEIGRLYPLAKLGTEAETMLLAELGPVIANPSTAVREWIERDFTILYLTTPDRVYMINLKHHRQFGY